MKLTFKKITSGGNSFIYRWSIALKEGSIKVHLILNDDKDEPHTHPWDFTSLMILPYKEIVMPPDGSFGMSYDDAREERHYMFETVKRTHDQRHAVQLYRFMGMRIPALTIGRYSKKNTLCSFCKDLGYCKQTGKPIP